MGKSKTLIAKGASVSSITSVPAAHGRCPCLLANTSNSSVAIIDCIYGSLADLTSLSLRHHVKVAHLLLPLKCCWSPSDQGYLISASEDKAVYIYNLGTGSGYQMTRLKHHQAPVVAVAVNLDDTVLATADSSGRIVMWRREEFFNQGNFIEGASVNSNID